MAEEDRWVSSLPNPMVTVVIDTYNYGRFIERAIDSVLQQAFLQEQIEILIVDDGSTDDTPERVGRYGDRVRYFWKPNGGQASALNLGLRQARGEVICLLDADDYFYPAKVSRVVEEVRNHPNAGLIYNEFDIVDGQGRALPKAYPNLTWTGQRVRSESIGDQQQALILLGHPWTCPTSTISLRRPLLGDLQIPEEIFPQSPDVFLGLVLPFMTRVAVVDTPLTGYVYHGDNVGLFRASARNRQMQEHQEEYVRRYIEERFDRRFITYRGRSVYGRQEWIEIDLRSRISGFAREARQVWGAQVDLAIKRSSLIKLAAAFLLPTRAYDALKAAQSASIRLRHHQGVARKTIRSALGLRTGSPAEGHTP
jgi:glycosyltransferase involved in cell wall biosynthesis